MQTRRIITIIVAVAIIALAVGFYLSTSLFVTSTSNLTIFTRYCSDYYWECGVTSATWSSGSTTTVMVVQFVDSSTTEYSTRTFSHIPSYICPNPDTSTYTMCRLFTQPGMAIIQEDSQGRVLEDLLLNGAPIGSTALWRFNGTIIVTFPNASSVTCDILHSPLGPCLEGVQ